MDEPISKYRVSTITCNASIGTIVNLNAFFTHVNVTQDTGFVWVEYGKNTRGTYPKTRKDLGSNKKCFDNQATVIYKMESKGLPIYFPNIKLFRNGSVQMTGIRTREDGARAADLLAAEVERMRQCNTGVVESTNPIVSTNFTIRMINCDFGVEYNVRRKKLHQLLISSAYNNACSFQPVDYPGVILKYYWNTDTVCARDGRCLCDTQCFGKGTGTGNGQCKKITVSTFDSGKILITGANSFQQVNSAYKYIIGVISDNESALRKPIAIADDGN